MMFKISTFFIVETSGFYRMIKKITSFVDKWKLDGHDGVQYHILLEKCYEVYEGLSLTYVDEAASTVPKY